MIEIRHKRTGALILEVAGDTLAGARLPQAALHGGTLRGSEASTSGSATFAA